LLVFAYIYILQSSVRTHLPCGGIFRYCKLSAECASERIVKIGQ